MRRGEASGELKNTEDDCSYGWTNNMILIMYWYYTEHKAPAKIRMGSGICSISDLA
jgi:hypothetical protein